MYSRMTLSTIAGSGFPSGYSHRAVTLRVSAATAGADSACILRSSCSMSTLSTSGPILSLSWTTEKSVVKRPMSLKPSMPKRAVRNIRAARAARPKLTIPATSIGVSTRITPRMSIQFSTLAIRKSQSPFFSSAIARTGSGPSP